MEQKRTLWIVAAVGVFLLVVLGAALILYTPQTRPATTIANSRRINNGTASNGWISLAPSAPAQNSNPIEQTEKETPDFTQDENQNSPKTEFRADEVNIYTEKANVYSENTELNKLGENAVVSTKTSEALPENAAKVSSTTIDLTQSSAPKTAESAKPAAPKVAEKTPVPEKSVKTKTVVKTEQTNTVKAVKTEQKKAVAAKPAAKEPEIVQYWIQVTALTSRKSADEARSRLDENQISADVFTYTDNKKQLFYRVRVGPYTTKSEAEYWRTKISKIDSFQNTSSYITSTTVAK